MTVVLQANSGGVEWSTHGLRARQRVICLPLNSVRLLKKPNTAAGLVDSRDEFNSWRRNNETNQVVHIVSAAVRNTFYM